MGKRHRQYWFSCSPLGHSLIYQGVLVWFPLSSPLEWFPLWWFNTHLTMQQLKRVDWKICAADSATNSSSAKSAFNNFLHQAKLVVKGIFKKASQSYLGLICSAVFHSLLFLLHRQFVSTYSFAPLPTTEAAKRSCTPGFGHWPVFYLFV